MRHRLLIAIGLSGLTFAVFVGVLNADFVLWDDDINVTRNLRVQTLTGANLAWMFTDLQQALRYKPLSWLSWSLLYAAVGLKPSAYHLANLLFHSLNAALVFLLLRKFLSVTLLKQKSRPKESTMLVAAALSTLLWSLHPLRVEPVAWITGLPYCQSMFFLLVSLWCYLEASGRADGTPRRKWFYWGSVATFALSLFTYPIVLGCVGLLVMVDVFLVLRLHEGHARMWSPRARKAWLEKLPFVLPAGLLLGVALIARIHAGGFWVRPAGLEEFGVGSRIMQAFYIWAYYLWKPCVPAGLCPLYTTLMAFKPGDWPFALSLLLVVSVTVLLLFQWRRWSLACALWLCHLALLVPVLGVTEHPHFPSDRYSYVAGVILSVGIGAVLLKCWAWPLARVAGLSVLLLALCGETVVTVRQTGVWANSETLLHHILSGLGKHVVAGEIHLRLGVVLTQQGRSSAAMSEFAYALRLDPTLAEAHSRLAYELETRGQTSDAVAQYREAIRLAPELPDVLNNLAWLLATDPDAKLRDGPEAVRLAERACELTRFARPVLIGTLAAAYAETGRFAEAVETAQKARVLAAASGEHGLAARNDQLLELYRADRPYHQPARANP